MPECAFCGTTLLEPHRCNDCGRGQPVEADAAEQPAIPYEPVPGALSFFVGLICVVTGNLLAGVLWPFLFLTLVGYVLLVVAVASFASAVWRRLPAQSA